MSFENRVMNTKKSRPDKRDYKFLRSGKSLPEKSIIEHDLPVRDQSSIGSCMSHAAVRAVEIQLLSKRGWFLEGSELYHYYMARKKINNSYPNDKGMTVRDGCKTIQKYGSSLELVWPYNIKNYNKTPSKLVHWLSGLTKASLYYRLTSIYQIKEAISQGLPVVCGVWVDRNYYQIGIKTKYYWNPTGQKIGGHAQVVTCYDDTSQSFIIENSWGKNFGYDGKYYIKYSDFSNVSFDWFVIKV